LAYYAHRMPADAGTTESAPPAAKTSATSGTTDAASSTPRGAVQGVAILQGVDFVLTDPLGRRFGYLNDGTLLNEIPAAFYSGGGAFQQFLIEHSIPGQYQVQLRSHGGNVSTAIAGTADAGLWEGALPDGGLQTLTITVLGVIGDADDNELVNRTDLDTLAMHWQQSGDWVDGDFSGDSLVNLSDLVLLGHYWSGTQATLDEGLTAHGLPQVYVPVPVPGDANHDGRVDDLDASILGAHWLHSGNWLDGDFNGDGNVNDADAAILAAHWGEGVGEESVPEPGSLALLAGMAVMGMVYLRRRDV
jgi:hypothetical protein